jgi:spermidine/putrescine-binding protein
MDSVCVPRRARNVESIYAFLDYIQEPQVNARIVNGISYASANLAARKFIRPEILNDPGIYPPPESLTRCEFVEDIGEATEVMDEYWTEIKSQ